MVNPDIYYIQVTFKCSKTYTIIYVWLTVFAVFMHGDFTMVSYKMFFWLSLSKALSQHWIDNFIFLIFSRWCISVWANQQLLSLKSLAGLRIPVSRRWRRCVSSWLVVIMVTHLNSWQQSFTASHRMSRRPSCKLPSSPFLCLQMTWVLRSAQWCTAGSNFETLKSNQITQLWPHVFT